ncbi:MAG: hypothetical protein V2B20_24140 [Pseudomonadota bacterium]
MTDFLKFFLAGMRLICITSRLNDASLAAKAFEVAALVDKDHKQRGASA